MKITVLSGLIVMLMGLSSPTWAGSGYMLMYMHPEVKPLSVLTVRPTGFSSWDAYAKWMGCDIPLKLVMIPMPNAAYRGSIHQIGLYVGLIPLMQNMTDSLRVTLMAILAHECQHYHQDMAGADMDSQDLEYNRALEYDAEAYAHRVLTILGYDATHVLQQMRHAFARYDDIPDDQMTRTHGSAVSVVEWARLHNGLPRLRQVPAP